MFVQGDSNHKGAVPETKIAAAATELGIPVLRPIVDHGRYDLGFEIGGRLQRVQCKWGALDAEAGVVKVRLQSQRHTPRGYVRTRYSADEIDLVAAYCGGLDRCYLLPRDLAVGRSEVWLRLRPARNGQRACINLAAQFEFPGAVAQLEERVAGSDEVRGSSPLSSTTTASGEPPSIAVRAHDFRNRFGHHLERAAAGQRITVTRRGRPLATLGPPTDR